MVFLVRLCTSPLRRVRSNAKLPFWLTGEKVSRFRCPLLTPGAVMPGLLLDAEAVRVCLVSIA